MKRLFLLILMLVMFVPSVAYADEPLGVDSDTRVFVIAAPAVQFIVALLIPVAVGLLTKLTFPGWLKGVITILLNAVNALVVTAVTTDGSALISQAVLLAWVMNTLISIATYFAVYKPAGITSSTPDGKLGPNSGLG